MGRVAPLSPGLADVRADGSGRAPNLVGQRVLFGLWEGLRNLEDLHCLLKGFLVHRQLSEAPDHLASSLCFLLLAAGCKLAPAS
jgi:hypothetical protein